MGSQTRSNDIDFPMPKVTIDRMVLERIRRYVGQCDTEISGFGFATHANGLFHIMDARVVKQDAVSGAHTDINKDALNALVTEWKDRDGVLVWWHSHVNMDTGWSSQDKCTILDLGKHWMCLAMVFNKRHEQRCVMSFKVNLPFKDGPQVVMIDDIPVNAVLETNADVLASWDKELKEALPERSAVVSTMGYNHHRSEEGWGSWENAHYTSGTLARIGLNQGWDPDDFWADAVVGEANDCDWRTGSHFIDSVGKWLKSFKQRQKERLEKHAGGRSIITSTETPAIGSPSATQDSLIAARREFAVNDEDIMMYHPLTDEFELMDGRSVDAEWYIKSHVGEDNPLVMNISELSDDELDDLYKRMKKEREQELAELEEVKC